MLSKLFKKQDSSFFARLKKVDSGYKTEDGKRSKCLEWEGAVFSNGYGRLGMPVETKSELIHRAHRYAYYLAHCKIKKSESILHKCDNRLCCNPRHLYAGDHRQNMRDMTDRERQAKGSRSGKAVFLEEDVAFIRFFYASGFTYSALAEMVSSSKSTISNLIASGQWSHVKDIIPSEKRLIRYIKSRIKQKRPLLSPTLRNAGSTASVKQCSVLALRELTNVFGQEGFAKMIGSTRKKMRVVLENPDDTVVEINPGTGDMKVFTETKGNLSPQRIVELIAAHSQ